MINNKFINSAAIASMLVTFLVFSAVVVHADTTNGGDDSAQPVVTSTSKTSTSIVNGGDDTSSVATNSTGSTASFSTTVSNGGDDSAESSVTSTGNSSASITNGGDDTNPAVTDSSGNSTSSATTISNGDDDTNPIITNTGGTSGSSTTISNGDDDIGGGSSPSSYTVSTSIASGSGTITCGDSACPSTVTGGTSLTFTANPSSGYTFTSWGGACTGTSSTCTLAINSDVAVSANFTAIPNNIPSGGGGSSNIGGSYSSGGGSVVILAANPSTSTCPLLTSYLKFGGSNDSAQVAKLQSFLKTSQGMKVTVNGTFDQQTENAVIAFQSKYLGDVMGPWGATLPSGQVYITTKNKINALACKSSLVLTPSELAIINSYKSQQAQNSQTGSASVQNPGIIIVPGSVNVTGSTTIIGQNGTSSNANVAAAADASVLQKLWNFIKSIF